MNRIQFIKKSASLALAAQLPATELLAFSLDRPQAEIDISNLNSINSIAKKQFNFLVQWLKVNGWDDYLRSVLNKDHIDYETGNLLYEKLTNIKEITKKSGFEDFGGVRIIEPGNPSLSLLYHALASPRVKNSSVKYPDLFHLDILENYIYELKTWEDYLSGKKQNNLQLMVLAYEYRPSSKTPPLGVNDFEDRFVKFAQLTFSRTGISRIGNEDVNYDPESRSFTNKPSQPSRIKNISVTPARFGLFLTELVDVKKNEMDAVKVMNIQKEEYTNLKGSNVPLNRQFIKPIRKIFDSEQFKIRFGESHLNQKLYKFSQFELHGKKIEDVNKNAEWNVATFPFKRISATDEDGNHLKEHMTDYELVNIKRIGSSALLSSVPNNLIRMATQNGKVLSFYVEPKWERRYNALKLNDKKYTDIHDSIWTEFIYRKKRRTSLFRALRNAPLFVNIKFKIDGGKLMHLDEMSDDMEKTIAEGGYQATLFEDSICDGCVSATLTLHPDAIPDIINFLKAKQPLPAFSLVTAPDFFPYIDSNDIGKYYSGDISAYKPALEIKGIFEQEQQQKQQQLDNKALSNDEHFLEGGSLNLSGIRQRGNPEIIDPFYAVPAFKESWEDDKSFDTLMAVTSNNDTIETVINQKLFNDNFRRDYFSNSFLPDSGTGIFFPGWDATYSGPSKKNPYFATFGLGSPFPEDIKLCAAANGMWPVASPDAGRTFQGSLEPFPILGKPNTSIPLMDDEIGYHSNSPHVIDHHQSPTLGWDGEQGPYLSIDYRSGLLNVNFTDIGRADYIANILNTDIGFDMSKLREIDSIELINRMDCLRKAVMSFDNRKVSQTKYWLVSAESVPDWKNGSNAFGIPNQLIGDSNNWAKEGGRLSGAGYLFVFALTRSASIKEELEAPHSKRRNQLIKCISICKVSKATKKNLAQIEWCELDSKLPQSAQDIEWKPKVQ